MFRIRNGFSLIELLVLLLMLAGATEAAAKIREQVFVASLKSDLANLATAQDAYFANHGAYTTALTIGEFNTSRGVSVHMVSANATNWIAVAAHRGTTATCTMGIGTGATTDGMPICS